MTDFAPSVVALGYTSAVRRVRVGAWLALSGAVGVLVISALYVLASPIASGPLPPSMPLTEAVAEGRAGLGLFHAAGTIGLVADALLVAGCTLLSGESSSVWQRLFWTGLGLATLIFVVVDGLASLPLTRILTGPGAVPEGYVALRGLFDLAFVYGVAVLAAASVAGAAERGWPPLVRALSAIIGIIGLLAFALDTILGITIGPLFGASVVLIAVLALWLAVRELWSTAPEPRKPSRT